MAEGSEGIATHNAKYRIIYREAYIPSKLNEFKDMFKCAPRQVDMTPTGIKDLDGTSRAVYLVTNEPAWAAR